MVPFVVEFATDGTLETVLIRLDGRRVNLSPQDKFFKLKYDDSNILLCDDKHHMF